MNCSSSCRVIATYPAKPTSTNIHHDFGSKSFMLADGGGKARSGPLKVSDVQRGSISFPARSSARDREDRRATARSPDYRLDGEKEEVKSSSCFPLVNTRWDVSSHVNAMHGFFSWAKPTNHGPNITDE
ncbi:hypothetical protein NL676_038161 [Syzygium grande]|nr:hypothetical protein NL676_038161 [Syzygium grande]